MASFSISSYTDTQVTIQVNGLSIGDTVRFFVRLDADTSNTTVDLEYTATSSTMTRTFGGLIPATRYATNVRHNETWLGAQRFTTDVEPEIIITPWSWTSSNGSATAAQTQAAYYAVTNKGSFEDFSYLVWNDMCAKVMECLNATDTAWSTASYGSMNSASYVNTLMTSTDNEMTAHRFNSLRYNVGRRYSTGITEVFSGYVIYGSYFTTLMSKVNEWINTL